MAFDFNGGGGFSPDNNTSPGFGGGSSGFGNPPSSSGSDNSFGSRNGGFTDTPEVESGGGAFPPIVPPGVGSGQRHPYRKRRQRTRRSFSLGANFPQVPFGVLMSILCVIVVVVCLWVYREAISAFLAQVLSWIITILIIVFLVKWFIFPKR